MLNIWNNALPVTDINSTVSNVNDKLSGTNEAIQGLRNDVQNILNKMQEELEYQINSVDDGSYDTANSTSGSSYETTSSYDYTADSNSSSSDNNSDSSSSSSGDDVHWIYKYDSFPKDQLDTDYSIVDRIKWHNYDSSFDARSQYYDEMGGNGEYVGSATQNTWMLDWMKSHGYAKGTKSATSGWHLYDEDGAGSEAIMTKYGELVKLNDGDHVFSKEMTDNLWKLAQNPSAFMPDLSLSKLPDVTTTNKNVSTDVNVNFGNVDITLPNVQNYEDIMKQAQKDSRFEQMVQQITLGQALGKSSLNKLKF
jgi:hypothetical protein